MKAVKRRQKRESPLYLDIMFSSLTHNCQRSKKKKKSQGQDLPYICCPALFTRHDKNETKQKPSSDKV